MPNAPSTSSNCSTVRAQRLRSASLEPSPEQATEALGERVAQGPAGEGDAEERLALGVVDATAGAAGRRRGGRPRSAPRRRRAAGGGVLWSTPRAHSSAANGRVVRRRCSRNPARPAYCSEMAIDQRLAVGVGPERPAHLGQPVPGGDRRLGEGQMAGDLADRQLGDRVAVLVGGTVGARATGCGPGAGGRLWPAAAWWPARRSSGMGAAARWSGWRRSWPGGPRRAAVRVEPGRPETGRGTASPHRPVAAGGPGRPRRAGRPAPAGTPSSGVGRAQDRRVRRWAGRRRSSRRSRDRGRSSVVGPSRLVCGHRIFSRTPTRRATSRGRRCSVAGHRPRPRASRSARCG